MGPGDEIITSPMTGRTFSILRYIDNVPAMGCCSKCKLKFFTPQPTTMTRLGQSSICDRDLKNTTVTEKHQKGTNLGGQACDLTLNFMSVCRHYCTVEKLTQEKAAKAGNCVRSWHAARKTQR